MPGLRLDVFGALSQLEFLDLSNCSGFTGTLEPLRHLVNLRMLSLAGCVRLTGGVEPVSRLMSLVTLDLEACAGLGGSLDDLHGLRNLEKLNVCDTPLVGGAEVFAAKHLGGAGRCQVGRVTMPGEQTQTPLGTATDLGQLAGQLRTRHDCCSKRGWK